MSQQIELSRARVKVYFVGGRSVRRQATDFIRLVVSNSIVRSQRYQVRGTVVIDMKHFLDPEQRFASADVARINVLNVGDRVNLGTGRTVERAE
jgi:hypothetical protein